MQTLQEEQKFNRKFEELESYIQEKSARMEDLQVVGKSLEYFGYSADLNSDYLRVSLNNHYSMTEWGFTQLCGKLGIPESYMLKCPVILKEANVNHWLEQYEKTLLLRTFKDTKQVRAVLSDRYGVLNDDILIVVMKALMQGKVLKEPRIVKCFYNDELLRLMVVDESKKLLGDTTFGFCVKNSEVGKSCFELTTGAFTVICSNGLVIPDREYGGKFRRKHIGDLYSNFKQNFVDYVSRFNNKYEENKEILARAEQMCITQERVEHRINSLTTLPKSWREDVIKKAGTRANGNLWELISDMTLLAQNFQEEKRMEIEKSAGELLYSLVK